MTGRFVSSPVVPLPEHLIEGQLVRRGEPPRKSAQHACHTNDAASEVGDYIEPLATYLDSYARQHASVHFHIFGWRHLPECPLTEDGRSDVATEPAAAAPRLQCWQDWQRQTKSIDQLTRWANEGHLRFRWVLPGHGEWVRFDGPAGAAGYGRAARSRG